MTWTRDGRLGAGSGDPATLFHFWRERNGRQLCAPPPRGPAAPALATLGTFFDPASNPGSSATSDDGSIVVTDVAALHTHATDWTSLQVSAVADGTVLRVFGATSSPRAIAISHPSGRRFFTSQGPDVAVWCR